MLIKTIYNQYGKMFTKNIETDENKIKTIQFLKQCRKYAVIKDFKAFNEYSEVYLTENFPMYASCIIEEKKPLAFNSMFLHFYRKYVKSACSIEIIQKRYK